MKKSEKIFGNLVNNPSFQSDILLLNQLLSNKLEQILKIYLKSKYRGYYHNYGDKFATLIDIPIRDSHKLWHLLDFFSYTIIPQYEINDIVKALNEITEKKFTLKKFIEKLKNKKTQDILRELDLIDDEIGNINPHYEEIEYSIQERKVLKDNKVLKSFPVIILQIITSSEESNKNVIELLEDDLDHIIDEFNDIKRKLEIIKGRIK